MTRGESTRDNLYFKLDVISTKVLGQLSLGGKGVPLLCQMQAPSQAEMPPKERQAVSLRKSWSCDYLAPVF